MSAETLDNDNFYVGTNIIKDKFINHLMYRKKIKINKPYLTD